jgi:hypothetical protein
MTTLLPSLHRRLVSSWPLRALAACFAVLAFLLFGSISPASASDHQDTSFLGCDFPAGDLTDLYVFESPEDSDNVVLAMDFDPLIPRGGSRPFDPSVLYQFKIDNSGNNVEDLVIQFLFEGTAPNQSVVMYGPAAPNGAGVQSTLVDFTGRGPVNQVNELGNGIKLFAGVRKDPFFFDLARFFEIIPDRNYLLQPNPADPFQILSFNPPETADDLLADFNVNSIVVELPKSVVGSGPIGVYMSTSIPTDDFADVPSTGTVFSC